MRITSATLGAVLSDSPYSNSKSDGSMINLMSSRMNDQLKPMPKRIDAGALVRGQYRPPAQRVQQSAKPTVMTTYAKGPVGFLQWLAAVHPQLYAGMRKNHPELLVQAHAITAQIDAANTPPKDIPECPGCRQISGCLDCNGALSGLGDWTDAIGSWVSSATNVIGNLANAYSTVKKATAGPQIQTQLQQAAQAQPPVNYGNAPATPPGGTVVTTSTSGFGSTGMMIGLGAVAVVGGLILFKKK